MVRLTDEAGQSSKGPPPGTCAATRRDFFDLLSDQEVDVLTAVFDRVLANVDRGTGDEAGPGRDLLEVAQRRPRSGG
jgi:hypothetical protein